MKEFIKAVFINRWGQVRSGWKIGLILGSYLVIMMLWGGFFAGNIKTKLGSITVDTIVLLGLVFLVLRRIDRKRVKDIGLTGLRLHYPDLGFGLMVGAVSMAVIFIVLAVTGQIIIKSGSWDEKTGTALLEGLLLFGLTGFKEEVFSRGYCLFVFGQMRRLWLSVLFSSLLFTLFHAGNPNLKGIGLWNIFLAGLLFVYMVVKTGNLWMAIGYHIAWNYFQGSVFGFPVSGHAVNSFYQIKFRCHNLLTGGLFGPEGGLLATGILLAGFFIVRIYTLRRKGSP